MYYKYMSTIIAWALFILIMTFLIFTAFSVFLNRLYPVELSQPEGEEELDSKRRRLIGLFVFIALIVIMTMTGINAFMNTR